MLSTDMQRLSKRRKDELAKQMGAFLQQYRRKAQKGVEPNDRHYDPAVERIIRRLSPEDLDVLLNGEEDGRLNASDDDVQQAL